MLYEVITDSIAYIAAARSLMVGDGFREAWLISNNPMTHFLVFDYQSLGSDCDP